MEDAQMPQSLIALETRLRRLEFLLTGHFGSSLAHPPVEIEQKTRTRIARLERGLNDLALKSQTVRQLLQLRAFWHATLPGAC